MKNSFAFIGGQNGDEGKGKIVEYVVSLAEKNIKDFSEKPILVYRWQGGPNAGHTVIMKNKTYKLHQLPSGVVRSTTYNLLGKGMFLNPRKLMDEIKGLINQAINITPKNLGISSKIHMILDYHVREDQDDYNLAEHLSTGNGIRQTARDKADRIGIRFVEFLDADLMVKIIKEKIFLKGIPKKFGSYKKFVQSYSKERKFLAKFLTQEHEVFNNKSFKYWIGEGAQGMMLDIDDGQYPGVTSSNPALPTHRPKNIIGVFKLYTSSVGIGNRTFVSEIDKSLQKILVKKWSEFGTTTGRPRHVGWFDAVATRYAIESAQMDMIAGTCLDRLEELAKIKKKIKVVIGYKIGSKKYYKWNACFDRRDTLTKAKPIFKEFYPWEKSVKSDGKTLTSKAKKYIDYLEKILGKKFAFIGTGPEHSDIIVRKDIFK